MNNNFEKFEEKKKITHILSNFLEDHFPQMLRNSRRQKLRFVRLYKLGLRHVGPAAACSHPVADLFIFCHSFFQDLSCTNETDLGKLDI